MKINPVKNHNLAFGTCVRRYNSFSNKFGLPIIKTSTNMFREDLDWKAFIRYVLHNFCLQEKVNTYSLACSDGSEAYSYAISMLSKIPEKLLSKFLPIKACDIDEEIIKIAKSGKINIARFEFNILKQQNLDISNYFENTGEPVKIKNELINDLHEYNSFKPIKELRDSVEFYQSDILSELNELEDNGNTIIMCRNVFPYLSADYTQSVLKIAQNKLKRGSLFVIGNYDETVQMGKLLEKHGFFRPLADTLNIYQKG